MTPLVLIVREVTEVKNFNYAIDVLEILQLGGKQRRQSNGCNIFVGE